MGYKCENNRFKIYSTGGRSKTNYLGVDYTEERKPEHSIYNLQYNNLYEISETSFAVALARTIVYALTKCSYC